MSWLAIIHWSKSTTGCCNQRVVGSSLQGSCRSGSCSPAIVFMLQCDGEGSSKIIQLGHCIWTPSNQVWGKFDFVKKLGGGGGGGRGFFMWPSCVCVCVWGGGGLLNDLNHFSYMEGVE